MEINHPRVGLAVIIINKDKVLFGLRKGAHDSGTWSFPGGHLEIFESFIDCGYREVFEETGLTRENIKIIDKNPFCVTNDFFKDDKHYITIFLRAKYISGEPRIMEPERCEGWKWISWNNIPNNLMLPIINMIKNGYNPFE